MYYYTFVKQERMTTKNASLHAKCQFSYSI